MKLVSLKQTYKEWSEPAAVDSDAYYPSIYFNEKTLDAMGIDTMRVGTEMLMISKVGVSSVNEQANGSRSMSFELLEAGFKPAEDEKDAASILFPNG